MPVLVLHSALGLRSGVHDAVRRLEAAGEHVPADAELLWQRAIAFLGTLGP